MCVCVCVCVLGEEEGWGAVGRCQSVLMYDNVRSHVSAYVFAGCVRVGGGQGCSSQRGQIRHSLLLP